MEELLNRIFPGRHTQVLKEAVQKGIGDADAEAREEARRYFSVWLELIRNLFTGARAVSLELIRNLLVSFESSTARRGQMVAMLGKYPLQYA